MDSMEIIKVFLEPLSQLGLAGFVITVLALALIALWRAFRQTQRRCDELVDKMIEMSRETNIMVERVTRRY